MVRIASVINPVVAEFIDSELDTANADGAQAFLIELDTPGGLDTSMRDIIQKMFSSQIPVIVYVAPPGARAASAGALITLAADFAVMAPGTNIGAAHPVSIGVGGGGTDETMEKKVLSDAVAYARSIAEKRKRNVDWAEQIVRQSLSSSASEALDLKVIDLLAESEEQLLQGLDGRPYFREGEERRIALKGVRIIEATMSWRQEILNVISNPNVAYLLLMLGVLGIFFEISQPGVILPGVVGAIALLLAFFAFQALPVNYAGVLLIVLAFILFILEVKVTSYGMLTVGGVTALALGSLMLIESSQPYLQISKAVIFASVAVISVCAALVVYLVVGAQKRRFVSGTEGLIGEYGEAVTDINGTGRVFVHGEYWNAYADGPIIAGERIEVVEVDRNMRLGVRKPIDSRE